MNGIRPYPLEIEWKGGFRTLDNHAYFEWKGGFRTLDNHAYFVESYITCCAIKQWDSKMSIDKSWIKQRNCLFNEYWNNIKAFVEKSEKFCEQLRICKMSMKKLFKKLYQIIKIIEAHIIDIG